MTHILSPPEGTTWQHLRTGTVGSLIVANLIPLFGALFLDWSIGSLVVLYWCETAVIGFYSLLKWPFATGWFALYAVPFFIVHFGFFLGVTGFIALNFYKLVDEPVGQGWEVLSPIWGQLAIFVPAFVVSHGVSFVTNFIGKKEYLLKRDLNMLMVAPYLRVGVMFGGLFLGAMLLSATGAPEVLMAGFIGFKIVADVVAHLREHSSATNDNSVVRRRIA